MKTQDIKSNDNGSTPNDSIAGQNDIRSRLRKNPNKTKHLYTDELNEKKTKKKVILLPRQMKKKYVELFWK